VSEPGDLLELARVAAREAGNLAMSMRTRGADIARTKSSPTDIVTEADRTSEELIRRRLLDARPGDGFVGEEGNDIESSSGVSWVVDPIDGTVNYLYGLPQYAVSIGARRDGEVVAGVVHAPALEVEYAATLGGGATCNGVPIQVRKAPPLEQALISTGFS
jgi:myo-inositol-1(or 4)-monophosphatase